MVSIVRIIKYLHLPFYKMESNKDHAAITAPNIIRSTVLESLAWSLRVKFQGEPYFSFCHLPLDHKSSCSWAARCRENRLRYTCRGWNKSYSCVISSSRTPASLSWAVTLRVTSRTYFDNGIYFSIIATSYSKFIKSRRWISGIEIQ